MNENIFAQQNLDYQTVKSKIQRLLKQIRLQNTVDLKEIEERLQKTDKIYDSTFLLGIFGRAMEEKNEQALFDLLISFLALKNFLPREDLGGLSPFEYEKKYPRGENEKRILNELTTSYQERLKEGLIDKNFDVDEDLKKYQKEFFNLTPLDQPFPDADKILTNWEILAEERKRSGLPEYKIKNMGVQIITDNIAEKIGYNIAKIHDLYFQGLEILAEMQNKPRLRKFRKVKKIFENFRDIESFMRCSEEAPRFYCNFASLVFLCGKEELAEELLDISLDLDPHYKLAKEMKRRFQQIRSE